MIAFPSRRIGVGNTSGRIAAAERIRDKLHYKSERRTMSFSAFLDKLQKMFMIFEEENEVITEQPGQSLVLLLKKVEHPPLRDLIGALVQHARATIRRVTFTE